MGLVVEDLSETCSSAEKAMKIAADSDIYTNHNLTWETLDVKAIKAEEEKKEKELEASVSKNSESKDKEAEPSVSKDSETKTKKQE